MALSPSGPCGGGGGGGRGGLLPEFEFHLTDPNPLAARIAINVDPDPVTSPLTGLGGNRSAARGIWVCALGRYRGTKARGGRMRMVGTGEEWEWR